ncbi:MAG: pyridoxine 5'-phosphate synthase [Deltaproteobacteria bacterium]|nr:pyridoxine 5'-phosphate synthase [Deltaproteobacteria bacterium]MCL5878227.1 pyridoxine 5'-phosphate synthase [Deltaproteobacteria bacterium]
MKKLGVNLDHIATVRQARKTIEPDPVSAISLIELAGANSIVMHLREDRRHTQDRDIELARKIVKTKLNLEMAPTQEMIKIALDVKPDTVTLVPERREELTTEGGLEVALNMESFKKYIRLFHDADITVSLFIDPDLDQVKAAHRVGADVIEISTARYSESKTGKELETNIQQIVNAVITAEKLKLGIAAGHGLTYLNIEPIIRIDAITEYNIGHSIIARAVFTGIMSAVREMKDKINSRL